jgi:hypothetical protein
LVRPIADARPLLAAATRAGTIAETWSILATRTIVGARSILKPGTLIAGPRSFAAAIESAVGSTTIEIGTAGEVVPLGLPLAIGEAAAIAAVGHHSAATVRLSIHRSGTTAHGRSAMHGFAAAEFTAFAAPAPADSAPAASGEPAVSAPFANRIPGLRSQQHDARRDDKQLSFHGTAPGFCAQ